MKLDIGYTFSEEGSATIEIDDQDYLEWSRSRSYNVGLSDEELLKNEGRIKVYLEYRLGLEEVSSRVNWGQEIDAIWDVDIIPEEN